MTENYRLPENAEASIVGCLLLCPDTKPAVGKLVSEGMGQWRPVDTNDTAEGQAHNRRVEVIISGRNLEEEGLTGTVEQYITQPEAAQPDTTQSTTE